MARHIDQWACERCGEVYDVEADADRCAEICDRLAQLVAPIEQMAEIVGLVCGIEPCQVRVSADWTNGPSSERFLQIRLEGSGRSWTAYGSEERHDD